MQDGSPPGIDTHDIQVNTPSMEAQEPNETVDWEEDNYRKPNTQTSGK